jgi:hypothetical protein
MAGEMDDKAGPQRHAEMSEREKAALLAMLLEMQAFCASAAQQLFGLAAMAEKIGGNETTH